MSVKNTFSITEARKRIFDIANDVQRPGAIYTLTDKGRPKAVIMSAGEFESWAETLEVMEDFPNLKKDIAQARREYKKGDYLTLDELLTKQGFVLADKSKNKYALHRRIAKKSAKRAG